MLELTFLNSMLLVGAAGVAAPIIIHLVMRERPRLVPFPALRFVRTSHQASRRRHRLKHLLLLLLRCLLLVFLAAALARPVLKSALFTADPTTPITAVLCFDDSYSMSYEYRGKTRLEAAREIARAILERLPRQSEAVVMTTSNPTADRTFDIATVRAALDALTTTHVPSVCYAGLERAYALLERGDATRRGEIYLFTDMTAVGWTGIETARPKTNPDVSLYVVDVGVPENQNVALKGLTLSRQVLGENVPLTITAELAAGDLAGSRVLELYTDGDVKKGQREATFQTGQSARVDFQLEFPSPGLHQGRVAIRERDAIAADNQAFFTVMVSEVPKVLLVSGHGGTVGHASEVHYLAHALSPPGLRQQQRERVRVEIIEPAALSQRRPADYGAVVLANVPALPPEAWGRLSRYVSEGGGLLIAAGDAVDPDGYAAIGARDLLPGTLGPPATPPEGVTFSIQDYGHPILSVFADGANGDLTAPLFGRYLTLAERKSNARVVVPFSDGAPALTEHDVGRGRVLFFASTVDLDWTHFPRFPAYVVFMNQLIDRLGMPAQYERNLVVGQGVLRTAYSAEPREHRDPPAGKGAAAVGEPLRGVRLPLLADQRGAILTGFPPGDETGIPLLADPDGRAFVFPRASRVGNYRVEVRQEDRRAVLGFSVNPATEESRLDRIDEAVVAGQFPKGAVIFARSRDELERAFTRVRVGKNILPYVMLIVLLIFVAESYLANRFYRKETAVGVTAGHLRS